MEIDILRPKKINVKTICVHLKIRDEFYCKVLDESGQPICEYDGYVPSIMPGDNSDYLELNIDIDTGKIINWVVPNEDDLKTFIESGT